MVEWWEGEFGEMNTDKLKEEVDEKTNLIIEGIRLLDRELNLSLEKSLKAILDKTAEQIEKYKK